MLEATREAFWTSVYAVLQVLMVLAAGAASTHFGFFEPYVRKAFAKFNVNIFFPCMCLGVAGSYDASAVVRYLPLAALAALHILLGLGLGEIASRLLGLEGTDRQFLKLMTAFNNSGGMPFMLLIPICQTWSRAVEEQATESPGAVLARAYCMVIIYGLVWTLGLFTIGKRLIHRAAAAASQETNGAVEEVQEAGDEKLKFTLLKETSEEDEEREHDSTTTYMPSTTRPKSESTNELIRSVSSLNFARTGSIELGQPISDEAQTTQRGISDSPYIRFRKHMSIIQIPSSIVATVMALPRYAAREPNISSSLLGVCIACVSPIRSLFFVSSDGSSGPLSFIGGAWETLGNCGPVISTLVLSGGLYASAAAAIEKHRQSKAHMSEDFGGELSDPRSICTSLFATAKSIYELMRPSRDYAALLTAACCLKLVLMPLLCFPLTFLASRMNLLDSNDPILLMVAYMQAAVPSSQSAVSIVQLVGDVRLANRLSVLYLPQYILSSFTVSVAVAVAISIVG
jgi:predicted permease